MEVHVYQMDRTISTPSPTNHKTPGTSHIDESAHSRHTLLPAASLSDASTPLPSYRLTQV